MPYLIFIMVSIPEHQIRYHRSNQTNEEEHGHLLDLYQNILSNVDIVILMIMVVPVAMMVVVMMIVTIDLFQSFANDSVHYERPDD